MPADPLAEINDAAALLEKHGFDVIAEHVRQSSEVFELVTGQVSTRGHSARREAAYRKRDAALRAAAQAWADLPLPQRCQMLGSALREYHGTSWARDRSLASNPHAAGSRKYYLFEALCAIDRPIGGRQLKRILGS
jgi:hypothetical protein